MNKPFTGILLAVSLFTAALLNSGCHSADATVTPMTEQVAPTSVSNTVPQMSSEAARATEESLRRDKRGY